MADFGPAMAMTAFANGFSWMAPEESVWTALPTTTRAIGRWIQQPTKNLDECRSAFRPTPDGSAARHARHMTDPRNVAHDKKVHQEKKHRGEEIAPDAEHVPQPGQKPALKHSDKSDEEAGADKDASQ